MKYILGYVMLFCMGMLASTSANSTLARLKSNLFGTYDSHLQPTIDESLNVEVGMSLKKLKGLDFFKGTIQMNVWLKMVWKDVRLVWDPAYFDFIEALPVHSSEVWKPDVTLYNSHSQSESLADTSVIVYSDGTVYCTTPMSIEATCDLDLRDYPYDSQSCHLKMGSWVHDSEQMSLTPTSDEMDLEDYWVNAMWDITNTSAAHNIESFACCKDLYEDIIYHLTLRRRETHGRIASSVIAVWLILIVFLIRPSGERIVFAGLVFVALVVFSAALSAEVPVYSVTRLGRFLMGGMLITAVVIAINGLIYRFHPKEQAEKEEGGSPSRVFMVIDIFAFLVTAIVLAITTGALFV